VGMGFNGEAYSENKKMKIIVYGPSMGAMSEEQKTFHYYLKEHYSADLLYKGCTVCSEERTLYEIKKQKIDAIHVIFHSKPTYMYFPGWHRDIKTLDQGEIVKKIFGKNILLPNIFNHNNTVLSSDKDALLAWYKKELDNGSEEFKIIYEMIPFMQKYSYSPELQQNRYQGALIQIDQYCRSKNLKVIHCLGEKSWYPKWFNFSSGIIDHECFELVKKNKESYNSSINGVSHEGNIKIYQRLISLIDAACSRQEYAH
jgi:hypothetical protein